MHRAKIIFLLLLLTLCGSAGAQIIYTIAGDGTAGYTGDGVPATTLDLNMPQAAWVDSNNNVYIADYANGRIRKVNTDGIMTTIAGGTIAGGYNTGDGGPATAAGIGSPTSVVTDAQGNVYFATTTEANEAGPWIRKIDTNGIISTIAGVVYGYNGDGGPATNASFFTITDLAIDKAGDIFIADAFNGRIREINTHGIINTVAGGGSTLGDSSHAYNALLTYPTGVTVDGYGNIYIADEMAHRIRMVDTLGIIYTIAGNGLPGYSGDGHPADSAELNSPYGITVDGLGNIYFSETNANRIRQINASGTIYTVAGTGAAGYTGDGGYSYDAELNHPQTLALDVADDLYFADVDNNVIRVIFAVNSGITTLPAARQALQVWPSPNNGAFNICLAATADEAAQITITDVVGHVIKETDATTNQNIAMQLSVPAGMYFITASSATGRQSAKIIVR